MSGPAADPPPPDSPPRAERPPVDRASLWLSIAAAVGLIVTGIMVGTGSSLSAGLVLGGVAAGPVLLVWFLVREFQLDRRVRHAILTQREICIHCSYPRPSHDGPCPECGGLPGYASPSDNR
ncbi:MAG: hypothetical protein AB8G96_01950 [Phycisphaerales bacterium]